MKLAIAIVVSSTGAADAALSTMRVGPRKLNGGAQDMEFGRPVDFGDVDAALQELRFAHMRYLQDTSFGKESGMSVPYPGMSFPNPGMSLPYPGMSLPNPGMSLPNPGMSLPNPGMSLPNPGMSLPNPGMSLPIPGMILPMKTQVPTSASSASPSFAPTSILLDATPSPSSAIHEIKKCTPKDMTAHATVELRLDVDSLSSGSIFLDSLASLTFDVVSYGEMFFSLCQHPGNRMMSEYQTNLDETETESAVTGLEATASPTGNAGDSCTPATDGAICTVVDLVLTVYSRSNDSSVAAETQVRDEIVNHLLAGEFINDDIIAVRLHQDDETPDVPVGLTTSIGGGQESPRESSDFTNRTIAIAVLVTMAVLALTMIVLVVYRKKRAIRETSNAEDGSKCDSLTVSADDITAHATRGSSV